MLDLPVGTFSRTPPHLYCLFAAMPCLHTTHCWFFCTSCHCLHAFSGFLLMLCFYTVWFCHAYHSPCLPAATLCCLHALLPPPFTACMGWDARACLPPLRAYNLPLFCLLSSLWVAAQCPLTLCPGSLHACPMHCYLQFTATVCLLPYFLGPLLSSATACLPACLLTPALPPCMPLLLPATACCTATSHLLPTTHFTYLFACCCCLPPSTLHLHTCPTRLCLPHHACLLPVPACLPLFLHTALGRTRAFYIFPFTTHALHTHTSPLGFVGLDSSPTHTHTPHLSPQIFTSASACLLPARALPCLQDFLHTGFSIQFPVVGLLCTHLLHLLFACHTPAASHLPACTHLPPCLPAGLPACLPRSAV